MVVGSLRQETEVVVIGSGPGDIANRAESSGFVVMDLVGSSVLRMRQEADATVAAGNSTACQTGMIAQDGIQRDLILTNKRTDAVVLVPIRAKRKEFRDGYDKNARFSVRMLIPLFISSSYPFDANASSGRAGIFLWINTDDRRAGRTTDSTAKSYLSSHAYAVGVDSPCHTNRLLGKKKRTAAKFRWICECVV